MHGRVKLQPQPGLDGGWGRDCGAGRDFDELFGAFVPFIGLLGSNEQPDGRAGCGDDENSNDDEKNAAQLKSSGW